MKKILNMKKLEYNKDEQATIIELLIEDLKNNIDYLISNVETIPNRKKYQTWFLTPALNTIQKLQIGGAINLNPKEQAAIIRSIKTHENIYDSLEYLNNLKTIKSKTK
jgi:hypothetical protein